MMMWRPRERAIVRGLPVHSPILFTFKPGNVIGVNPVGRTEND